MGDINAITQLIGTVGFPIVACAALFWENYKNSERHSEESKQFSEAIANNTQAVTELTLWLKEVKGRESD